MHITHKLIFIIGLSYALKCNFTCIRIDRLDQLVKVKHNCFRNFKRRMFSSYAKGSSSLKIYENKDLLDYSYEGTRFVRCRDDSEQVTATLQIASETTYKEIIYDEEAEILAILEGTQNDTSDKCFYVVETKEFFTIRSPIDEEPLKTYDLLDFNKRIRFTKDLEVSRAKKHLKTLTKIIQLVETLHSKGIARLDLYVDNIIRFIDRDTFSLIRLKDPIVIKDNKIEDLVQELDCLAELKKYEIEAETEDEIAKRCLSICKHRDIHKLGALFLNQFEEKQGIPLRYNPLRTYVEEINDEINQDSGKTDKKPSLNMVKAILPIINSVSDTVDMPKRNIAIDDVERAFDIFIKHIKRKEKICTNKAFYTALWYFFTGIYVLNNNKDFSFSNMYNQLDELNEIIKTCETGPLVV